MIDKRELIEIMRLLEADKAAVEAELADMKRQHRVQGQILSAYKAFLRDGPTGSPEPITEDVVRSDWESRGYAWPTRW